MKAVSNTTPLRYLIAIDQDHLLGKLFEKVFVPDAVHKELTDARNAGSGAPPRDVAPFLV
jgi:predicted nucleic acid-binding protein